MKVTKDGTIECDCSGSGYEIRDGKFLGFLWPVKEKYTCRKCHGYGSKEEFERVKRFTDGMAKDLEEAVKSGKVEEVKKDLRNFNSKTYELHKLAQTKKMCEE